MPGPALTAGFSDQTADFDAAINYALRRLARELPPILTYHNFWHTVADVLPAARRLAALSGVNGRDARLIEVAAAYHDIGFVVQPGDHERISAEIAAETLSGFGFAPEQVVAVQGMILATKLPQSPRTPLEEILVDADLDVLGREDALSRSEALRAEFAALGNRISKDAWVSIQLAFYRQHRYFTPAARALRHAGKARNMALLAALLPVGQPPSSNP